jgi:hypothetical protein
MVRDAEKWRRCSGTHQWGDGTEIRCHVIVGVNKWHSSEWAGFQSCSPDELNEALQIVGAARGIG